jgi:hypothetical protein
MQRIGWAASMLASVNVRRTDASEGLMMDSVSQRSVVPDPSRRW